MNSFMRFYLSLFVFAVGLSAADLTVLLDKAGKGDAEAQYQLAEIYAEAQGVEQDYAKSYQWAKKAADQGNSKAQYRLASIIFTGEFGPKNQPEALQLFLKSAVGLKKQAEEGDHDSQSKLGVLYAKGVGVKKDLTEAAKLFKQAAEGGHVKAQLDLAKSYFEGKGVDRNPTTAIHWFEKSAKAGHGQAQIELGLLYIQGIGCRQDIELGLTWIKKASTVRHPTYAKQAQTLLDRLKANPPKIGPDIKALTKRAENGELKAQLELANRYERGAGLKVDFSAVRRWLDAAVRQGSSGASHHLGGMLMAGRGLKENPEKAVHYWSLAARLGHGAAQVDYAVACAKGYGVEKNLPEAYYWTLVVRKTTIADEQQNSLRALQGVISPGLKPDEILDCLKRSRVWNKPEDKETRLEIVAAEYGNPEAQFARGLAIRNSHPIEALKWLLLAKKSKIKNAGKSADELTTKLSKSQVEKAKNLFEKFRPLGH